MLKYDIQAENKKLKEEKKELIKNFMYLFHHSKLNGHEMYKMRIFIEKISGKSIKELLK